jgi:phospholipase/lecithinase/hemolysin
LVIGWVCIWLQSLIEQGANTIMVHNIPPLGCYPVFIETLKHFNKTGPIDSDGCITDVNVVIQATNAQFVADLEIIRTKIPTNTSIIVADLYSIVNTIIRNGSQFGMNPKSLILSN